MSEMAFIRLAGASALACVVLWLAQFPLYLVGNPPNLSNAAAHAQYLASIKSIAFTRILLDQGVYVTLVVFAGGFRHLVLRARPDHEWAGTLVFGTALVWVAVTLVADGLEGGAVLDAIAVNPDPSAVRALVEGTLLIFNGSTAFAVTGVFLAAAAYAVLATGIMPRWIGWAGIVGAALCAACIPAMYAERVDFAGFYNAGGWGPAIIANFPPALWMAAAGIALIREAPRFALTRSPG
jgi:hypothetical protein